jgi:hypothetical protein
MIDISRLTDSDKGRQVQYRAYGKVEFGNITSWNEQFIFVRYHTVVEGHPPNQRSRPRTGSTSEATAPTDLEFCI